MQKDETASCTDSALNLGSVAKAINDVSQSKSDYSPNSCHDCVTSSPSFYDGLDYSPLCVGMKRDLLSSAQPPAEGNTNYGQQIAYSQTNSLAGTDAYHGEMFYREGETFAGGVDLNSTAFQRQDHLKPSKAVFAGSGNTLEDSLLDQNTNYFGVAVPAFPLAVTAKGPRDGQLQREKTVYAKDRKPEGGQKQNHDGKPIRILQRPALGTASSSSQSEKHSEDEGKMLDALTLVPQKRGHRKKTLSLNPEEREALENLVEEVIIGGFEEDIVSSDGSNSDDESCAVSKSGDEDKKSPRERQNKNDMGIRYNNNNEITVEKEIKSYNQNDAIDRKKNHFQKDLSSKVIGKYGRKDQKKLKENDHFISKGKGDHRNVEYHLPHETAQNTEKDKLDARGVQGLNIYPAQLKVAIKHMDSLPPRFLRRLQSGQNRMDLILPRRLELSSDEKIEPTATENDKGKSKETQLQETKKSIRHLLCDLDQYVDEGVATPNAKESLLALPFPAASPPCGRPKGSSIFCGEKFSGMLLQSSPQDMTSLNYLNQQPFCSRLFQLPMNPSGSTLTLSHGTQNTDSNFLDEKSNYLQRPMVYHCEDVEKLLKSGSELSTLANDALYTNNTETGDFTQETKECFAVGLCKQSANASLTAKKSQFSVDAPEFVSAFFKTDRAVDPTSGFEARSVNQAGGRVNFSQPGMHMETGQCETTNEILPPATATEGVPRLKYLGMHVLSESMTQYQQPVSFVPSSTMLTSTYIEPPVTTQLPTELFMPPPQCPPPIASSHAMVGIMPYQPYQLPPYVPGFSHPEFPIDRSNFLLPTAPNWIGELQPSSSVPVPAMGWCPPGPGPAQSSYVSCSMGQQVSGKNPMILCNPGQVPQDPKDSGTWSCLSPYPDFDVIFQKVTDLLLGGGCILVILVNEPAIDLSGITSQLQMITDDTVMLRSSNTAALNDSGNSALNPESANGSNAVMPNSCEGQIMNSGNDLSDDMAFKYKQAVEEKRRLIVIDHTNAQQQPWEIQNYIATAQGQGYHVEVIDLNEFGQYSGADVAGSYMFDEDYQNPVVYPLPLPPPPHPPPLPQFFNGYTDPMPMTRGLTHGVS